MTKEEIRSKYNIAEKDFEILTSLPSTQEIQKRGFLVTLFNAAGVHDYLWKSWQGILIAVIIGAPIVSALCDFWQPKVVTTAVEMYQMISSPAAIEIVNPTHWIAVLPPGSEAIPSTIQPTLDMLPGGTGLFPVSGRYI
jgi:hypothetical protein